MSADRRERLLALLAVHDTAFALLCGICDLSVSELAVTGARVRMLGGVETNGGVLAYSTDLLGAELDDLASSTGTGPCVDAFELGHPVLVSDLAAERVRWPGFTADAVTAGVAAVFSFPLLVGAVGLGVLELHRAIPGPLSAIRLLDALLLADLATNTIFDDLHAVAPMTLPSVVDIQAVVHQATGFVAVELEVSLPEALMRIRGYAFAQQRTLSEVAKDIIERRLRLEFGE
ncbi:MAG TPA: GAF and ANTAR domain-containing protein [Actinophytocola sp.]|nr:GAF and ANTAR domain-containing protein [Actinophytocola sp.]